MPTSAEVLPGDVFWAELDPTRGPEQSGRRPVLVVASVGYLETVDSLVIVVPVTSTDRGWPNHVALQGLPGPSWAMTEQVRTIARARLRDRITSASTDELKSVKGWLSDFLGI